MKFGTAFAAACLCTSLQALAGGVPAVTLDAVSVEGEKALANAPLSATEGYVTAEQLAERPIARAGELLEFVPGLMVTQHSGEGKANQYFLRGFNLDHGTDFYTEVDGLPVNMRTHGHGQGYADINFIIPELIGSMEYRKGPYFADVGDFAAAGSANLRYKDDLPQSLVKISSGEFGYLSALAATAPQVGEGKLLLGIQAGQYDGAYDLKEDSRRYAAVARYNSGTADEGYTFALMGYSIDYNAPDQIPLRAVQSGQIPREGFIDATDGGDVRRYSLSGDWRGLASNGSWSAQAYALRYRMDLYSDFTYYFTDPTDADALPDDQFEQFDDRKVYGLSAKRNWSLDLGAPTDIEVGLQSRYDDIGAVGLYLTQQRQRTSTVREDSVREASAAVYAQAAQQWLPWLRSTLGVRADNYWFDVDSSLGSADSGNARDAIVSPKAALVLGPWAQTEFYLNYGEGFHSNDARGTTAAVDPVDPLVKASGYELGINSFAVPDVKLSASLWHLDFDSELIYVGDAGTNEPSAGSKRWGAEVSAYWQATPWLIVDADYAYAHARLDTGERIPNSIENVASLGLTLPETHGLSAGLRVRRLGAGPLIEDNSARSEPTTVVNLQGGYRFLDNYTVSLAVLNLFDSSDNDITYYYESRLPGEAPEGVADYHFHPVEPRAFRLTLGAEF